MVPFLIRCDDFPLPLPRADLVAFKSRHFAVTLLQPRMAGVRIRRDFRRLERPDIPRKRGAGEDRRHALRYKSRRLDITLGV
jgi:hypothetical protein